MNKNRGASLENIFRGDDINKIVLSLSYKTIKKTYLVISFAEVGGAEVAVGPALANCVPQLLGHHQVLQHVRDRLNQVKFAL